MQVMGGIAVASEHRINRIWRDLRVDRVSGGTDEMMILTASKDASIKCVSPVIRIVWPRRGRGRAAFTNNVRRKSPRIWGNLNGCAV